MTCVVVEQKENLGKMAFKKPQIMQTNEYCPLNSMKFVHTSNRTLLVFQLNEFLTIRANKTAFNVKIKKKNPPMNFIENH